MINGDHFFSEVAHRLLNNEHGEPIKRLNRNDYLSFKAFIHSKKFMNNYDTTSTNILISKHDLYEDYGTENIKSKL